jgi:hypothetical protein
MMMPLGGDGEFVGLVQVPITLRMIADFQAFEDLALHGGAPVP